MKFIYFPFLLLIYFVIQGCSYPRIIDVIVVDMNGNPVPSANLHLISYVSKPNFDVSGKSRAGSSKVSDKTAISTEEGKYSFIGFFGGSVSIKAGKNEFYSTQVVTKNSSIKIPLRKKVNPITFIKKEILIEFPLKEGNFGFDILIGDLVEPHGNGVYSDLVLKVEPYSYEWRDNLINNTKGKMTVSSESGGFLAHILRRVMSPTSDGPIVYSAPQTGYQKVNLVDLVINNRDNKNKQSSWYWTNDFVESYGGGSYISYFFKVRSELDNGPLYGMITRFDGFSIRDNGTPYVSFHYFVNPDGTTNLEKGTQILYFPLPNKNN